METGAEIDLRGGKLKNMTSGKSIRPGRTALLLAVWFLLGACASRQTVIPGPPRLVHSGPEVQIVDVDVLAVTPAMDEFLDRYILPPNSQTRTHLLYQTVLDTGVLAFDYDESRTLTAAEAFDTHSGNCIGFSNMMVALAREAGLKANYQEITEIRVWAMNERDRAGGQTRECRG